MKKQKNLILLAIGFYLVAGLMFSSLFFAHGNHFTAPKTPVSNDSLYAIKPELSEAATEASTEVETTAAEVSETESPAEETTAPPETETVPEETGEPVKYYEFALSGVVSRLHVRTSPSILSESIGYLPPGTTGLVLEAGDSWVLIKTPQITGYAFREYLILTEISKEDYESRLQ